MGHASALFGLLGSKVAERPLDYCRMDSLSTSADQIPVAPDVVDPAHARPEFVFARPGGGECGSFARVRSVPRFFDHRQRGVRRVLEQVVLRMSFAGLDFLNFTMNGDDGVAETVHFLL